MNIVYPDYYTEFKCIADKCKHSCCIGWEIDIDADTFKKYKNLAGDFAQHILNNVSVDDVPHFKLTDDERCPFLNKNGLCDIITTLGEHCLCQICSDHPRYRNFFTCRTEIGLGLCCEECARIIITKESPTVLVQDNTARNFTDEEAQIISIRNNIFEILQNRKISLKDRILELLSKYDITLPHISFKKWHLVFSSLEILDPYWKKYLKKLKTESKTRNYDTKLDIPFEQLAVYFIYRHFSNTLRDGRIKERIAFAVLSIYIIGRIFDNSDIEHLIDISRCYSAEIEYSEENLNTILDILKK